MIPLQILPGVVSQKRRKKQQDVRDKREAVFPLLPSAILSLGCSIGQGVLSVCPGLDPGVGVVPAHGRSPPKHFGACGVHALGLW